MSGFQDRTLVCGDCGNSFVFTAGEQAFYSERSFSDPKRCKSCRAARKAQRTGGRHQRQPGGGGGGRWNAPQRTQRQMYDVICAECGQPAQVPFRPSGDRPVYCRECYQAQR